MSDLIDRQAAVDELDKGAWGVEWDKTLAKTMIKSLPSAQPEITEKDVKEYCRKRCLAVVDGVLFEKMKTFWALEYP